jgi:hypothetical protein
MARKPASQIQENLTTNGDEFVYPDTGLPYSGKYHIISGQPFAGENQTTFKAPIPLTIPTRSVMAEVIAAAGTLTAAYELAKQNIDTAKNLYEQNISPLIKSKADPDRVTQRNGVFNFFQKSNDPDKVIKEISGIDVLKLRKDPINRIVTITFGIDTTPQQIEEGEKIIPGLKSFLAL